tara:strand:- start:2669 stop:4339 length:1671 start_codon:yes stop_codon:yes gene_type:complete
MKIILFAFITFFHFFAHSAGDHIHVSTTQSPEDLVKNGKDFLLEHANHPKAMRDHQAILAVFAPNIEDGKIRGIINEVLCLNQHQRGYSSNCDLENFKKKFQVLMEELSDDPKHGKTRITNPTNREKKFAILNDKQVEKLKDLLNSFDEKFKLLTGTTVEEFSSSNYRNLFSWSEKFAMNTNPTVAQFRRDLFPGMHKTRRAVIKTIDQDVIIDGTSLKIKEIWDNFSKRWANQGHSSMTIMMANMDYLLIDQAGNEAAIRELKNIFLNNNINLKVSHKVNFYNLKEGETIPLNADEIDLFTSTKEYDEPGATLLTSQVSWSNLDSSTQEGLDSSTQEGLEGQKRLRDALVRWVDQKENPVISFHMFEGEHLQDPEIIKQFFSNLSYVDNQSGKKLKITVNHSMTLTEDNINFLSELFPGRVNISFQPSTYKILGENEPEKIAKQLQLLLENTKIGVKFGSDDPGLYTCTRTGRCYGDPIEFFDQLLSATENKEKILTDENALDLIHNYLRSIGSTDNPTSATRLDNLINNSAEFSARGIDRQSIIDHITGQQCAR